MSTTDYQPIKKSIHIEFSNKEGLELHDLLNYYRLLRKVTWRELVLEGLRDLIATENQPIADAITQYMRIMPKGMGRPRRRVVTLAEKQAKSNVIKKRWEENEQRKKVIKDMTEGAEDDSVNSESEFRNDG